MDGSPSPEASPSPKGSPSPIQDPAPLDEVPAAGAPSVEQTPESKSDVLKLLQEIRDDQKEYFALRRQRWDSTVDYAQIAKMLWKSPFDVGTGNPYFDENRDYGKEFFDSLFPSAKNAAEANKMFIKWCNMEESVFPLWNHDYLSGAPPWDDKNVQDPYTWPAPPNRFNYSCKSAAVHTIARKEFSQHPLAIDPFPKTRHTPNASQPCGFIVYFDVNKYFNIIDFTNATAIVSLIKGTFIAEQSTPQFLDGHISKWRERPIHERCGSPTIDMIRYKEIRSLSSSSVFIHYMRSFVVGNFDRHKTAGSLLFDEIKRSPDVAGFKCIRDSVTFQGFYDGEDSIPIMLVEKRYSIALSMLPLKKPAGHFALVSICDDECRIDRRVSEVNLFWRNYRAASEKYAIHLAGLYTGISLFQIQICTILESWEKDWMQTLESIEEKVNLKPETLENNMALRRLVLDNKADASVLYFKVLQILNFFSNVVRDSIPYLDSLSQNARNRSRADMWFQRTYPHTQNTRKLLDQNWETVEQLHEAASLRILARLERTKNEVKNLQDGLFNVQSITEAQRSSKEAQKSRTLNKYLVVFTVVTILFLPPTFVATFFGMDTFQSGSDEANRKLFWTVFAALSGVTYFFASLALFGSHLSAERRKEQREAVKKWWNQFGSKLASQAKRGKVEQSSA